MVASAMCVSEGDDDGEDEHDVVQIVASVCEMKKKKMCLSNFLPI